MQDVQTKEINKWVRDVAEFQEKFEKKFDTGTDLDIAKLILHRVRLVHEESQELYAAAMKAITALRDGTGAAYCDGRVEMLDAIADEIYVLIGMANALGMDLSGAFDEVHKSNMSKLGSDGKPIFNAEGKTMKGPNYIPPDLRPYAG